MGYQFEITPRARKDIEGLDAIIQKRLRKKLDVFAACSDVYVYAKRLKESPVGEYRIRVGDYRMLLDIRGTTILLLRVRHRRESYLAK